MKKSEENKIINQALKIMESRVKTTDQSIGGATESKRYCRLKIGANERETFMVVFLNCQNKVIKPEILFQGTVDSAAVYPREVVKAALKVNASSVILSHNHPSGNVNPSFSDKQITKVLIDALDILDIKVLDHIIVSSQDWFSFAEKGMI